MKFHSYLTPVEQPVSFIVGSINAITFPNRSGKEKFRKNIPRLREYLFIDCCLTLLFFSSSSRWTLPFPTGKHPHNCMISIDQKKNKRKENFLHREIILLFDVEEMNNIRKEKEFICVYVFIYIYIRVCVCMSLENKMILYHSIWRNKKNVCLRVWYLLEKKTTDEKKKIYSRTFASI